MKEIGDLTLMWTPEAGGRETAQIISCYNLGFVKPEAPVKIQEVYNT